jgi:nucleoside-diphosphate kinase
MPRERTFIMIKPDGVQRGLVSKIIARFEEKGFKLVRAAPPHTARACACLPARACLPGSRRARP